MRRRGDTLAGCLIVLTFATACYELTSRDIVPARVDTDIADAMWNLSEITHSYRLFRDGAISWLDILRKTVFLDSFYFPFGRYCTGFDLNLGLLFAIPVLRLLDAAGIERFSAAYNVPLFTHLLLDVLVLFLLLRRLRVRRWLSLAGAVLPLLFPFYDVVIGLGHLQFVAYWPVLLLLHYASRILTAKGLAVRDSVFAGASGFCLLFANLQYTYFFVLQCLLLVPFLLAAVWMASDDRKGLWRGLAINGSIVLVCGLGPIVALDLHRIHFPHWYFGLITWSRMGARPPSDLTFYAMDAIEPFHPGAMVYLGISLLSLAAILAGLALREWFRASPAGNPEVGHPSPPPVAGASTGRKAAVRPLKGPAAQAPERAWVVRRPILGLIVPIVIAVGFSLGATRYATFALLATAAAVAYLWSIHRQRLALGAAHGLAGSPESALKLISLAVVVSGILVAASSSQTVLRPLLYRIEPSARVYLRTIGMAIPALVLLICCLVENYLEAQPGQVNPGGGSKSTVRWRLGCGAAAVFLLWLVVADLRQTWWPQLIQVPLLYPITRAHRFLKREIKDAGQFGAADFSVLSRVSFGSTGGLFLAVYTGGKQGIALECDDGRFLSTFAGYGGKYIITDIRSMPCFEHLSGQPDVVHLLRRFEDGSAVFALNRSTRVSSLDQRLASVDASVGEQVAGLPDRALVTQLMFPIVIFPGLKPIQNPNALLEVSYRWRVPGTETPLAEPQFTVTKPLYENPAFAYWDSRAGYFMLTHPYLYRTLQVTTGAGVAAPSAPGVYELEIHISSPNLFAKGIRTRVTVHPTL